jgi:PIN domain nuclease of toxin-antitoxin system
MLRNDLANAAGFSQKEPNYGDIYSKTIVEHETAGNEIIASSISAWAIATLARRKRLVLSMNVNSWPAALAQIEDVRFVAVDAEIATKSVDLAGDFHKDLADRVNMATARELAVPLVTKDARIRACAHLKTIW